MRTGQVIRLLLGLEDFISWPRGGHFIAEKSLRGCVFIFIRMLGDWGLNLVSLERLLNTRLALIGVTLGIHIAEGLMLLVVLDALLIIH